MNTKELAHTPSQLFNQLRNLGYSKSDIHIIFKAYQYCVELADGFQACGKPFIVHLIRTASILGELKQDISVIAAGLLHSVYDFGDFGDGSRGFTPWKQKQVRKQIGETIENYIQKYDQLHWNDKTISLIYAGFEQLNQTEKTAVLMRLCNELEQCIDLEYLYRSDYEQKLKQIKNRKKMMVEMAEKLGYFSLSSQIKQSYDKLLSVATEIDDPDLRDSQFFSKVSRRLSVKAILAKRLTGELQKRT